MTPIQFERWKDFAQRMAATLFEESKRPSAAWIQEVVNAFFDHLCENDIPCIVDWDSSEVYQPGSPYYSRTYKCPCWDCKGVGCDKHYCESGHVYNYSRPCCVGDMMSEFLERYIPAAPRCKACRNRQSSDECRCDELDSLFYEQWSEQWGGPVRCCIRAGLDMASAPSAGVIGFTAGDVRRMYPEGVPDWVFPPDETLKYWLSDESTGKTFAQLDDADGVIL